MTIPTILSTYRLQLASIQLWDVEGLSSWIEEVAFWMARVEENDSMEDATRQRWMLVMAGGLEAKTGKPLELCFGVLSGHVSKVMAERG